MVYQNKESQNSDDSREMISQFIHWAKVSILNGESILL